MNASDTLTIEPGTAVLGMAGEGRQSFLCPPTMPLGVRPRKLCGLPGRVDCRAWRVLACGRRRGVSDSILVLGRSIGRFGWHGCQGVGWLSSVGRRNQHLVPRGVDQPSQTGGIGTGEDRAEGVVDLSGQDRHVYGGNTAPLASSGTLKYMSLRHGSTNLGWNNALNGNETDLLQLAGCGEGTTLDFVELVASADDGLHVLGGTPDVRHVVSAFHAEDAFESDQGWQGTGQWLFGLQDTALAHPTNPRTTTFCGGCTATILRKQRGLHLRALHLAVDEQSDFAFQWRCPCCGGAKFACGRLVQFRGCWGVRGWD